MSTFLTTILQFQYYCNTKAQTQLIACILDKLNRGRQASLDVLPNIGTELKHHRLESDYSTTWWTASVGRFGLCPFTNRQRAPSKVRPSVAGIHTQPILAPVSNSIYLSIEVCPNAGSWAAHPIFAAYSISRQTFGLWFIKNRYNEQWIMPNCFFSPNSFGNFVQYCPVGCLLVRLEQAQH